MLEVMFKDLPEEDLMMMFARMSGAMVVASLVFSALCHVNPLGASSA